jgi:hemerythrin superfamily protein
MDAIELLDAQHRDVERLFSQLEGARGERKARLFRELADLLAIHATIEENHFYPMVKTSDTEDLVMESLEEHLAVKRLLADLMKLSPEVEEFDAKLTVLEEQVEHHVKEEREELFPQVRRLLDAEQREAIGQIMTATIVGVQSPRLDVPLQTRAAPPLEPREKPLTMFDRLMAPFKIAYKAAKEIYEGIAHSPRRQRPA